MHVLFLFVYMYSNSKRILGNKITIITCFSIFNNFVFHISLLNMKKKPFCQIVRVKYICEIFLGYIYCNLLPSFLIQKWVTKQWGETGQWKNFTWFLSYIKYNLGDPYLWNLNPFASIIYEQDLEVPNSKNCNPNYKISFRLWSG